MTKTIKRYINLTNGIEAIEGINGSYNFIRIQSTMCEQKNWDRIIQELDYTFLMDLALGNECVVYDYGARKPIPRAMYQGLEFIKYTLNKRWLDKEYVPNVSRSNRERNYNDCSKYFYECYKSLDNRTKKKLDYFMQFLNTDEIKLSYISQATIHDGDKEFYRRILIDKSRNDKEYD